MAFENTLQAIGAYNKSLQGGKLVDEGQLNFVLSVMFVDIQNEITGGSSSLPAGGTTGQVLSKASNTDNDVEWVDASAGGDFLPLEGGTMLASFNMGSYAIFDTGSVNTDYIYNNGATKGFDIASGVYFNDNNIPLNYLNDYSANYTNRSLVDKAYVEAAIQAAIDAIP
jgi:hypothetical protein